VVSRDVVNGLEMVRNVIKEPMLKVLWLPINDVTGQHQNVTNSLDGIVSQKLFVLSKFEV
jgi:hypothetical protein